MLYLFTTENFVLNKKKFHSGYFVKSAKIVDYGRCGIGPSSLRVIL